MGAEGDARVIGIVFLCTMLLKRLKSYDSVGPGAENPVFAYSNILTEAEDNETTEIIIAREEGHQVGSSADAFAALIVKQPPRSSGSRRQLWPQKSHINTDAFHEQTDVHEATAYMIDTGIFFKKEQHTSLVCALQI